MARDDTLSETSEVTATKRRHKGERLGGTDDDEEEKEVEKEEKFQSPRKCI